jgi:hypothetical protein
LRLLAQPHERNFAIRVLVVQSYETAKLAVSWPSILQVVVPSNVRARESLGWAQRWTGDERGGWPDGAWAIYCAFNATRVPFLI